MRQGSINKIYSSNHLRKFACASDIKLFKRDFVDKLNLNESIGARIRSSRCTFRSSTSRFVSLDTIRGKKEDGNYD